MPLTVNELKKLLNNNIHNFSIRFHRHVCKNSKLNTWNIVNLTDFMINWHWKHTNEHCCALCEKVMEKDELSGSTQIVYQRNPHHYHHHHHHLHNHHHHHHHYHPLPLLLPSPLHVLPALNRTPVGLFNFLFVCLFFCFFHNLLFSGQFSFNCIILFSSGHSSYSSDNHNKC